jgi:cobalt/nickel transport protein
MKRKNMLLIAAVAVLVAIPLFIVRKPAGEGEIFAGADDRATAAIEALNPGYKPWFKPLFEPPSGEVETMLFALQAALGAGIVGYYLGLMKGRAERRGSRVEKPCT